MADKELNPYAAASREADFGVRRFLGGVPGDILATPWQRWLGQLLDFGPGLTGS